MTAQRPAWLTVVILGHDRVEQLLRTIAHTLALPERPAVVVVDNGSRDGSPQAVRGAFPAVELVALPANIGAAARNEGLRRARTRHVAFSDDDTCWQPGSLARAAELLDAHPRVAVITARVLVGTPPREDPTCRVMAASPLPRGDLPGPALAGFMAGACVFRRAAYLQAGGYEPRLFIGGEEALLALDLAALGWAMVYAPELTVHHQPSPIRDAAQRRRLLARNALLVAWLRRPLGVALQRTLATLLNEGRDPGGRAGWLAAWRELPWAWRHRRVVPPSVEAQWGRVERSLRTPRRPLQPSIGSPT